MQNIKTEKKFSLSHIHRVIPTEEKGYTKQSEANKKSHVPSFSFYKVKPLECCTRTGSS